MKYGLTTIFLLISTSAMAAGSSAGYEYGGKFERYDPVVSQYNRSGELFRIEGHCQSSCTLFLGIRNVCIDPAATLLFHSAQERGRVVSPALTRHFLPAYNARLRSHLLAQHALETLAFYTISGRDMIQKFGYRQCPAR